jgi:PAS domain S-box-containing protein
MRNLNISKGQAVLSKSYYSDPLFKAIFDDSPDAIFLLKSADFKIIECNKKAISLFQAQHKNDLVGFEIFNLYDAEPVEFSKNQFIDAINNGLEYSHELAFRSIRGNVFWGRYDVKPIEISSDKVVVFRVRRVVDYMKTAEMLSVLVKHTSMVTGIEFFNMVTALLSKTFDMRYCIIARLSSPGSQSATTLSCWINGSQNNNFTFDLSSSASMNVLKGYITFYPRNLKEMFPADELANLYNAVSYMGAPVYNSDGLVIGLIIMMDDKPMEEIPNSRYVLSLLASRAGTELNRLDILEKMQHKIEDLDKEIRQKDKFIQLIFNDLLNPLGYIMNLTDTLKVKIRDLDVMKITQSVKGIDASVKNIFGLLNSLAEWSEFQHNSTVPFIQPFDLYEIVKETFDLYYYVADSKDVQLISYIYPGTLVSADKNMIKSVLRNFIAHILKYTESGGQLIIDAMALETNINLTIQLTGIKVLAKDFIILLNGENINFKTGKHNHNDKITSLTLCKEILELNNAEISCENATAEGVNFTIKLPSGTQE